MTVSNAADSGNRSPEQIAARDAVIEADYRAGLKPLRQIGTEHGLSHTAIGKMAKLRGWERDLNAKIQARAEAKVAKAAVSTVDSKTRVATENQVVEANATAVYEVRIRHRTSIGRVNKVVDQLIGELEQQSEDPEKLRELLLEIAHPEGEGDSAERRAKARVLLEKHLGTASRIGNVKTLTETLDRLVKMERVSWGIEGGEAEDNHGTAAGAAAAAANGAARTLSDAERAVRLSRLLATGAPQPEAAPA